MRMLLAHALVPPSIAATTAAARTPEVPSWMLFLHGILGSGANWRTFAKQIVAERPGWGAVLVDLRLHGESRGFEAPHTVARAASDVVQLVEALGDAGRLLGGRVDAVLGHSFGGKVALALTEAVRGDLAHLFVVDSTPSARPDRRGSEDTQHIVDLLHELPSDFPDRDAFLAWTQSRGVSRPTAMWLAMNVKPEPNTARYVFRLDVAGVRALLDDYFATDLWRVLEAPPGRVRPHLVVGGRSSVVDGADRARAAAAAPRTTFHVIEDAGHWVHVDAPDALRAVVLGRLDGR
jgi:pimeloyl-ACP methyl ester carboxylesterase